MIVNIMPHNAGFVNRVLVLNISPLIYIPDTNYITDEKIDLAVVLPNSDVLGVSLLNNEFYIKTANDFFGPYNNIDALLASVYFGKVDGLSIFKKNIYYNELYETYEININGFKYNPYVYKFNKPIKTAIDYLSKVLKVIDINFVFDEHETLFKDGIIPQFAINLNKMFDDMFSYNLINGKLHIKGTVNKYQNASFEVEGKTIPVLNFCNMRGNIFYVPIYLQETFVQIVNNSSVDDSKIVLGEYYLQDNKSLREINESTEDYKMPFKKLNIVNNLIAVILSPMPYREYLLFKVNDSLLIGELDFFKRKLTIKDFDTIEDGFVLEKDDSGILHLIHGAEKSDNTQDGYLKCYLNKGTYVFTNENTILKDNMVYSTSFVKNIRMYNV